MTAVEEFCGRRASRRAACGGRRRGPCGTLREQGGSVVRPIGPRPVIIATSPGRVHLPVEPTFDTLLAAAQSGQPRAFEELYRALAPAVSRYLWLNGATDPEGLTNEVFLGVFLGLVSFSGLEPQFRSWVFTIAHRRLIDDRRQVGRRPSAASLPVESLDGLAGGNAEDDAMGGMALDRMRDVLACLTAEQRRVLLLRLVADLTVDQVAEATGKSAAAVKSLQRKGLEGIRRRLDTEKVAL